MQVVGAVFIGYILAQFLDFEFFTKSTSTPSDSDDSSQNPFFEEYPDEPENTIEEVWSNPDGDVKVWKIGVTTFKRNYENYQTSTVYSWEPSTSYHYQIGNSDGTLFTRESTGFQNETKITTYSTKEAAIVEASKTEEEPEPDTPQTPPEPEPPTPPPPPSITPSFGGSLRVTSRVM
tara:strand:- start:153 stop:683 length:531 start_codon:yes stop_codon:yes gene_type:complete